MNDFTIKEGDCVLKIKELHNGLEITLCEYSDPTQIWLDLRAITKLSAYLRDYISEHQESNDDTD